MGKMKYVLILPVLIAVSVFQVFSEEKGEMSFFITSVGSGDGANLGGLDGADRHCLTLAQSIGSGDKTWRAYLSTDGKKGINARVRIGSGPWYNVRRFNWPKISAPSKTSFTLLIQPVMCFLWIQSMS